MFKYSLQTSVKIYKLILKHKWKCEGSRIAKKLLKKNNLGGLFKFCYKPSKITIMYYYHIKNTHKIILCLRPSVKVKTTKFSEENIEYLCNLGVGKDFLNIKSRIHERKSWQTGLKKTLAGDLRTHTFCPVRGEMKKRKRRQPNGVLKMNKIFWQMLHWRRHQMVLTRRSREGGMTQGHGKQ